MVEIKYIEDMPQSNHSRYAMVDIDHLFLDEDNPRFASYSLFSRESGIKQTDIINYLVQYAGVSDLAFEINKHHGLFGEDIMSAYVRDGRVVVLEGNRRLCACKLLLDNSLLYEELKGYFSLPSTDAETRENIQQIMVLVYDDSSEAQKYIASKHTQTNIKKWTVSEQHNYYYTQFQRGKSPQQIARDIGATNVSSIEKKIRAYVLFNMIFDIVKEKHPDLQIGFASIRPVVDAFMPKLLRGKGRYSLGMECDSKTFRYNPLDSQRQIFNQILLMVGEAFLVRPEAKTKVEIGSRSTNEKYRISSDEIKAPDRFDALVEEDIRIPGLKKLIREFLGEDLNSDTDSAGREKSLGKTYTKEMQPDRIDLGDNLKEPVTNQSAKCQRISKYSFIPNEKQTRFFADLKFEHLDIRKDDNKGLIAVAREIKKLSCDLDYSGYYKFPLAASFLLRSLIEQTLWCKLKETKAYEKLRKSTQKATPELAKIINTIHEHCQDNNYLYVGFDAQLYRDFTACFDGAGTKNQLDKIIHSPAECQPNKEFLDCMANGGLKSLLQKIINQLK